MTTQRKRHHKKLTKRKINPDFITAVRAAKLIRISCCNSTITMPPDRARFHRLARFILHTIIHERQIHPQNLIAFQGYELNPNAPLAACIPVPYTSSIDHQLTVSMPSFTPDTQIIWPPGTTHCKMIVLAATFDFVHFSATQESASTQWIAKQQEQVPPVYLTINLPPANHLPVFLVMGIAFTRNQEEDTICHSVQILRINC